MCIGMANGGKSLIEELRKNSSIKNTNGIIECDLDLVHKTIQKFAVEVVEEQESIIMQTIQQIGGEEYSHITIDKNKVVDAFKKQIPRRPVIPFDSINNEYECPDCPNKVNKTQQYCDQCGQALDWSDTK